MGSSPSTFAEIALRCEKDGITSESAEQIARQLAKLFRVHDDEVAILKLDKGHLHFLYPAILQNVGTIPVNTTGSVAAHVASTRKAEIRNNFAETRHASVFEAAFQMRKTKPAVGSHHEENIIHKLMSVPVMSVTELKGVIQLCRKGISPLAAGPDFAPDELQKLLTIAAQLGKCFKTSATSP